MKDGGLQLKVYELSSIRAADAINKRLEVCRKWQSTGGVLVISYEMFRSLTSERMMQKKPEAGEGFRQCLADPGPELVICDEGHLLKNEKSSTSKAMSRVHAQRRIILTGTPLQNNLVEYHCMVQFVKPNLLGNKLEFTNRFANPIRNGQCADSTDDDVRIMKRRAHVLYKTLQSIVHHLIILSAIY